MREVPEGVQEQVGLLVPRRPSVLLRAVPPVEPLVPLRVVRQPVEPLVLPPPAVPPQPAVQPPLVLLPPAVQQPLVLPLKTASYWLLQN